jgi:hypothetical protein
MKNEAAYCCAGVLFVIIVVLFTFFIRTKFKTRNFCQNNVQQNTFNQTSSGAPVPPIRTIAGNDYMPLNYSNPNINGSFKVLPGTTSSTEYPQVYEDGVTINGVVDKVWNKVTCESISSEKGQCFVSVNNVTENECEIQREAVYKKVLKDTGTKIGRWSNYHSPGFKYYPPDSSKNNGSNYSQQSGVCVLKFSCPNKGAFYNNKCYSCKNWDNTRKLCLDNSDSQYCNTGYNFSKSENSCVPNLVTLTSQEPVYHSSPKQPNNWTEEVKWANSSTIYNKYFPNRCKVGEDCSTATCSGHWEHANKDWEGGHTGSNWIGQIPNLNKTACIDQSAATAQERVLAGQKSTLCKYGSGAFSGGCYCTGLKWTIKCDAPSSQHGCGVGVMGYDDVTMLPQQTGLCTFFRTLPKYKDYYYNKPILMGGLQTGQTIRTLDTPALDIDCSSLGYNKWKYKHHFFTKANMVNGDNSEKYTWKYTWSQLKNKVNKGKDPTNLFVDESKIKDGVCKLHNLGNPAGGSSGCGIWCRGGISIANKILMRLAMAFIDFI